MPKKQQLDRALLLQHLPDHGTCEHMHDAISKCATECMFIAIRKSNFVNDQMRRTYDGVEEAIVRAKEERRRWNRARRLWDRAKQASRDYYYHMDIEDGQYCSREEYADRIGIF